jgi:hypothetical protein
MAVARIATATAAAAFTAASTAALAAAFAAALAAALTAAAAAAIAITATARDAEFSFRQVAHRIKGVRPLIEMLAICDFSFHSSKNLRSKVMCNTFL